MQTRIINSINGVSSDSNADSGVSLAYDKEKNGGNKHHVVLDTTLDVSSSSDDHSNVDGRNNSGRLSAEDMNDNNKRMSTSSSDEEKLMPSSPSYDSTEANCNNKSTTSIAKQHNKMIDGQTTTTADDDDKNTNEKGCEVVISDNTSTNKAADVSSSTTICKSSNDDNNQPSHNLEDTSTTTANLNKNNNNTTKAIVNDKKEASQRANTTNNQKGGGGGGPYSSSSSHIYALREIISSSSSEIHNNVSPTASCEEVQYDLLDNEEEEEKKECSRPIYNDINSTNEQKSNKVEEGEYPRIITSQIVKTNQDMYKLLECNTAGKVLCKQQPQHHGGSSSSTNDDNEANAEVMLTDTNGINFTACTVSSIIDQMKNTDVDIDGSSSDCTTLMVKNCPISFESSAEKECEDIITTLPTKKKKYLPIKIYKSIKQLCQRSPIKQHRAKKKKKKEQRKKKPKMVIKNGIIDWSRSENLENCSNIDEHMLTVVFTTGSVHQDEEKGMKKQQKRKGKNRKGKKGDRGGITLTASVCSSRDGTTMPEEMKSLGATIFSDESVINNTIKPINEVVCINKSLGIYVSESGLSATDCTNIINVSEHTAKIRGSWSSYTYAKQTLGCRENDALAFVCARPVMIACATICKHLIEEDDTDDEKEDDKKKEIHDDDAATTDHGKVPPSSYSNGSKPSSGRGDLDITPVQDKDTKKKELVLDVREPHVVKYDTSKTERQKLDMHTDKSIWTFLIALSEGRGKDYGGGGTYFQALNSTVHLQRSQMIIFRGKRRHCGVAINSGCRYLLVGFLVPSDGMVTTKKKTDSKSTIGGD